MNYLTYLLKAKGRHGTHSPFVYAFVEQALHRPKESMPLPATVPQSAKAQTLFRVLQHLSYRHIYISPAMQQALPWIKMTLDHALWLDEVDTPIPGDTLLILSAEQAKAYIQDHPVLAGIVKILVWHPQNKVYADVESLWENPAINCSLFTWNFSLLVADPAFKRKQHYILR